jgi:hypothetical protein
MIPECTWPESDAILDGVSGRISFGEVLEPVGDLTLPASTLEEFFAVLGRNTKGQFQTDPLVDAGAPERGAKWSPHPGAREIGAPAASEGLAWGSVMMAFLAAHGFRAPEKDDRHRNYFSSSSDAKTR